MDVAFVDVASAGTALVRLAAAGSVTTAVVAFAGSRLLGARHHVVGRRLALGAAAAALAACGVLTWALLTGDFSLLYVADATNRRLPWPYRLAALWGGLEGSLLFLSMLLAVATAVVATRGRRVSPPVPLAAGALAVVTAGHLLVLDLAADPFRRLAVPAIDGGGLVPILEHPAMVIHPPVVYAGLVAAISAAALVVAGGPARTVDALPRALVVARAAWLLLTIGMVLGAVWAFVELGWGGYWAWDPIENSVLLPWLALTFAVHASHHPARSRHCAAGVVGAGLLALGGGVLTRSGVADSVHAFAEAARVGRLLGGFVAAVAAVAIGVLVIDGRSRAGTRRGSPARRRSLLDLHLVASAATGVVIGTGTLYPVVAAAWGDDRGATDGSFYAQLLAPVAVVAAAGAAWTLRRAPRATIVAHVGFLVLLTGVAWSTAGTTERIVVAEGSPARVAGREVALELITVEERSDHQLVTAVMRVGGVGQVRPALELYEGRGIALAETAVRPRLTGDVVVALRRVLPDGRVLVEATVRPGTWLIWGGSVGMAAGIALGMGDRRRRPERGPAPTRAEVAPARADPARA